MTAINVIVAITDSTTEMTTVPSRKTTPLMAGTLTSTVRPPARWSPPLR
jgi:hypothetical protein